MSKPINDGGPAFPRSGFVGDSRFCDEAVESLPQSGMTLRDWFAGMALHGWYGSEPFSVDAGDVSPEMINRTAKLCYAQADAMLNASKL